MPVGAIDILLVENNLTEVDLILRVLRQSIPLCRIHVAHSGEEALEYLLHVDGDCPSQCRPKLILLDLGLGKVDGLAVLLAVKNDLRTKSIPVVVFTSSLEEKDLSNSYDLGANSYIQKPVNFDEFRETVKQLSLYWLRVNRPLPAIVS